MRPCNASSMMASPLHHWLVSLSRMSQLLSRTQRPVADTMSNTALMTTASDWVGGSELLHAVRVLSQLHHMISHRGHQFRITISKCCTQFIACAISRKTIANLASFSLSRQCAVVSR